jgi:integrase
MSPGSAATYQTVQSEHALISLLVLNGLRVSEATGADIEHLGLECGHRTLTITRKGGKVVTPHKLRHAFITAALDAGVPLCDVQEAASHTDPRITMRLSLRWPGGSHRRPAHGQICPTTTSGSALPGEPSESGPPGSAHTYLHWGEYHVRQGAAGDQ